MNALLTARRIKRGQEEAFRRRWRTDTTPDGMLDAYLLEDEQDPRETLSISFWDTAQQLLKYRTGEEARKREQSLSGLVEKDRWRRSFVAFGSWDIPKVGRGKAIWLFLPLLLAGAGAATYFVLKQRTNRPDEWDDWAPEAAESYQPPEVLAGTPLARPIEPDTHNGGQHVPPGTAPAAAAQQGSAQPPAAARSAGRRATSAGTATAPATRPASGERARTVADLMTPNPETVDQMADVATAARRMRELNVGVLPVTADGKLAGMITDRDIALGVSSQARPPGDVRVQELMSALPATVRPDATVEEAGRIMADRQIRRLPVVDGARLVGILSLGDLATEGAQAVAGAALHEISEPATPTR